MPKNCSPRSPAKLPESRTLELAEARGGQPRWTMAFASAMKTRRISCGSASRQHAWEAGGSQVGPWLHQLGMPAMKRRPCARKTCLHYIPIMDVDNAAIGAGGKEALPRDHNRDWADEPIYPEVAAAQRDDPRHPREARPRCLHRPAQSRRGRSDLSSSAPSAFERMTGLQQRNYQRLDRPRRREHHRARCRCSPSIASPPTCTDRGGAAA